MPSPPKPERLPGAALARELRSQGIGDPRVLEAIRRVPRSAFLPLEEQVYAEENIALPIGHGQTISQPYMVARMTQELALTGSERILEIGTGSGYQAAVLALLSREVYTVERIELLSLQARAVLDSLGLTNLHFKVCDGTQGWPEAAPFDRIIVTAAALELPRPLFDQLAEGGILVAPLGSLSEQYLYVIRKHAGAPVSRAVLACRFVPLIGADGADDA